jgi:hypothetical protein
MAQTSLETVDQFFWHYRGNSFDFHFHLSESTVTWLAL